MLFDESLKVVVRGGCYPAKTSVEREKDGMTRTVTTEKQGSLGKIIFNGKKNVYFLGGE